MKKEQVLRILKKGIPFLICLFLILLMQTPGFFITSVPFVFIPIFYFSVFRPSLLNDCIVFGLGVFADLITRAPFGIWTFVFVQLFFIAHINRLFLSGLTFNKLWFVFGILGAVAQLMRLLLFVIFSGNVVSGGFLVVQYVILILVYPLGIILCGWLNNRIGGKA